MLDAGEEAKGSLKVIVSVLLILNAFISFIAVIAFFNARKTGRRCAELENEIQILRSLINSKLEMGGSISSDAGVIAVSLLGFFILISISFAIVALSFGSFTGEENFDFGAYVFPGVAAIFAGFGLYVKGKEKLFFTIACVFVVFGLVCYVLSKKDELPHVLSEYEGIYSVMWLSAGLSGIFLSSTSLLAHMISQGRWAGLRKKDRWGRVFRISGLVLFVLAFPFYVYSATDQLCIFNACPAYGIFRQALERLVSSLGR